MEISIFDVERKRMRCDGCIGNFFFTWQHLLYEIMWKENEKKKLDVLV